MFFFEQVIDLDVASVIYFIFAYSVHYIFIFSLPFDHYIHYLKYPYQKQVLTNIFQNSFASFALLRSKYILFSSVTIVLATVRLAASLAFCSVRIAAIIIGCINCAVLTEDVVFALLHRYYISRLGEHIGLLVEPRTR